MQRATPTLHGNAAQMLLHTALQAGSKDQVIKLRDQMFYIACRVHGHHCIRGFQNVRETWPRLHKRARRHHAGEV